MATTEEAKQSKKKEPRYRVMEVVQYHYHDENGQPAFEGEEWINEAIIDKALSHKTIKEWAWVYHDKDPYTEDDKKVKDGLAKVGDPRPPHFHVVINCGSTPTTISTIATWFGVPNHLVDIKAGRNGWLEGVRYLTHEAPNQQDKGKHHYEDEEIHASFDFRKMIDKRYKAEEVLGYTPQTTKDLVRGLVMSGVPLSEIEREYPVEFMNDIYHLEKLRAHYVKKTKPMPNFRVNFYLEGEYGMGKTQLAKLLARCLFPDLESWDDDELYYMVGGGNSKFDRYNGQPVIIWDEARAADIIYTVGREDLLKVFDPFPSRSAVNVKHSNTTLTNAIHIVSGIEPFDKFIDGLAGEYTDKNGTKHEAEYGQIGQFYRRFPFFISLTPNDFQFFMSEYWLKNTREYDSYLKFANMQGNFQQLLERAGGVERKKLEGGRQLFEPVTTRYTELKAKHEPKEDDGKPFDAGEDFAVVIEIPVEEQVWRRGDSTKKREELEARAAEERERRAEQERDELYLKLKDEAERKQKQNGDLFDDDLPY